MNLMSVASPMLGRSVEGLVAPLRECVCEAVLLVLAELANPSHWLMESSSHDVIQGGDDLSRSAWSVVAITLIESALSDLSPNVDRAFRWFGEPSPVADPELVNIKLASMGWGRELQSLLPYLLDTYGRTSRLDVMRNASLGSNRAARKREGSFYTPADVVDFMASSIAGGSWLNESWFDPACGSGAFLAGLLKNCMLASPGDLEEFALSHLHGCDISRQACDFAAFTVLSFVSDCPGSLPFDRWRSIRKNIVAMDSVTEFSTPSRIRRAKDRLMLGRHPLRLICNPPYAQSAGQSSLSDGQTTKSLYLPFVEMMWTVANGVNDAACMVVPLSLGANRTIDHRRCRSSLSQAGGAWKFLFFDRQPHALFGEDAKTRATIAIRKPGPAPSSIATSGLLKWTSQQRAQIFSKDRSVFLGQMRISRLIPKITEPWAVKLYDQLSGHSLPSGVRPNLSKILPHEIIKRSEGSDVFVAATAYNFLNVFRTHPSICPDELELSTSPVHRLSCVDTRYAAVVHSILASRLAFWLWHVECDGFHVPSWFLTELPLLNIKLSEDQTSTLAFLGELVWEGLNKDILHSVNKGKVTVAFRPTKIAEIRSKIDQVLIDAIGGDKGLGRSLEAFEAKVVSIDGASRLMPDYKNLREIK